VAVVLQNPAGGGKQGSGPDQGLRIALTLLVRPFPQPQQSGHLCRWQRHRGDRPIAWLWLEQLVRCPSSLARRPPGCGTSPCPLHEGHSHSRHPLVLEGDESHVEPLERDAVALGIELVRELLLQLPVVLLGIHLREQPGPCCARQAGARASSHALPCPCWGRAACSPARTLLPAQSHRSGSRRCGHRGGF